MFACCNVMFHLSVCRLNEFNIVWEVGKVDSSVLFLVGIGHKPLNRLKTFLIFGNQNIRFVTRISYPMYVWNVGRRWTFRILSASASHLLSLCFIAMGHECCVYDNIFKPISQRYSICYRTNDNDKIMIIVSN